MIYHPYERMLSCFTLVEYYEEMSIIPIFEIRKFHVHFMSNNGLDNIDE